MIQGDFKPPKLTKGLFFKLSVLGGVGLGGLVVLVLIATFILSAWFGRPVIFGYSEGPDQPIAFPHQRHVQDVGLDCTFCHRNVTTEAAATIPPAGLCTTCHKVIGDGLPEIEKLREIVDSGDPIDWVRVHRVPDHVQFVHEAHIRFFSDKDANLEQTCQRCHGDVTATAKVQQNEPLKMGQCVDCHKQNSAPTDCTTCHY